METRIEKINDIEPEKPILIEGLPGIGIVGKLSADQLLDQLETEKYADIYSPHFQPQVDILEDSTIKMKRNELHIHEREEGKEDLLILAGVEQGVDAQGQHEMSKLVIEEAEKLGTEEIYTLGGYATKQMKEEPEVFGAVTHEEMKEDLKEKEVSFEKKGPIGGAAGLLLGYGAKKEMKGTCLMGETHGKFVDPNASKQVLKVLGEILDLELTYEELEEKAEEVKNAIDEMKKAKKTQQTPGQMPETPDSSMEYIQ